MGDIGAVDMLMRSTSGRWWFKPILGYSIDLTSLINRLLKCCFSLSCRHDSLMCGVLSMLHFGQSTTFMRCMGQVTTNATRFPPLCYLKLPTKTPQTLIIAESPN